ncbi:MAG: 1-acyl-sn-glycerol-3-phosphate acyltransferase [Firmicutes bacterium]|nr:1-acyl-sn-glycerol-3-phosphate acyltransferase [Bacillota bacterium]
MLESADKKNNAVEEDKSVKADKKDKSVKKTKKVQKYNRLRHKFWFCIGRPLVYLFLKIFANFKRKKADLKKGQPYLILGNHTSELDPLMVICSVPGVVHALASDHLFKHAIFDKFVRYIAEPIPIVRAQMDLASIKEALQAKKDGGSILIFPEANCCFNAKTSHISHATAKLIRQFKIPVAIFNTKGGYLTHPRWANSWRRGKTTCELVKVIEADELAKMSVDEIYDAIGEALDFNDMEYQREQMVYYHGHDLLDGVERALYHCPKCYRLNTLKSDGDYIGCTECGYRVKMNHYGFFEGDGVIFDSIDKWDDWQRERAVELVTDGHYDKSGKTPILISRADKLIKSKRAHPNRIMAEGTFALYCDRIEFVGDKAYERNAEGELECIGPKTYVWKFSEVSKMSCISKNKLQIAVGEKEYYEIHSNHTYRSSYAYMVYFYCLKRYAQGKPLDYFGM